MFQIISKHSTKSVFKKGKKQLPSEETENLEETEETTTTDMRQRDTGTIHHREDRGQD